jgi:flagellin
MSLVLNTNISSLNAQNNLTSSQASLSQALQRLSSGLRINSAADDAAGLAISQQFTTQINGTNQAINNANDAVSEAQTAGGALSTLTNNLQSIRTLAVEAANGSNSASDRAALDQQVQQQIAEITQIASQTTFNGANVLDGSSGVTNYQVGANVGNTIAVNLSQGVRADQIGQVASATTAATSTALAGGLRFSGTDRRLCVRKGRCDQERRYRRFDGQRLDHCHSRIHDHNRCNGGNGGHSADGCHGLDLRPVDQRHQHLLRRQQYRRG